MLANARQRGERLATAQLMAPGKKPASPAVRDNTLLAGVPATAKPPGLGPGTALPAQAEASLAADALTAPERKLAVLYEGRCGGCGAEKHRGLCKRPAPPPGALPKSAEMPISLNSATGDSPTRALTATPAEIAGNELRSYPDVQTSRTTVETWGLPSATGIEQSPGFEESAAWSAW